MARKPAAITHEIRSRVRQAARAGCTWDQIEVICAVPARTLRKYCAKDFREGKADAKMKAGSTLFQMAMGSIDAKATQELGYPKYHRAPNLAALIFYLKTQCGYKEGAEEDAGGKASSTYGALIQERLDRIRTAMGGREDIDEDDQT